MLRVNCTSAAVWFLAAPRRQSGVSCSPTQVCVQGAIRSKRRQKDLHAPSIVHLLNAVRPFMLFIPCSMSHRPECISFSANPDIACACVGS